MKNSKLGFLATMMLGTMFLAACGDSACREVQCVRGACIEGTCICEAGFEGDNCETSINAKFSGIFSLEETCSVTGDAGPYFVTLAPAGGSDDAFTILGLREVADTAVTAIVNVHGTSFTIDRQPVRNGADIGGGSGTISTNGNTINLSYNIYPNGAIAPSDQCTATLTRI